MRKIGFYIIFVITIMILIPVIILGGIGSGVQLPKVAKKVPNIVQKEDTNKVYKNNPKINVYVVKEKKLLQMDLEEYIKGVVSGEMPVSFNIEALKSQAIAARTFAVANMVSYGGGGYKKYPGADVSSDVDCQVWISKEDRFKAWNSKDADANWKKIQKAVDDTKGMILTYNGQIAGAIKYHSSSGGKTEDSINVFGYSKPYLTSVESPYEKTAPVFQSKVVLSRNDFIKKIKSMSPENKISNKNIAGSVKILGYTDGGRVKEIKIGNKVFTGIDIRWGMGLKSAAFSIAIDKKNVTFSVRGYGHGVGMSQWGANEMGKRGKKYSEILEHYYKGTKINIIDNVFKNK